MATRDYFGLHSITEIEGHALVRQVVSFLRSEEGNWSFASLSEALDILEERIRKEFGTEETLVETVWELWPQVVLAALVEPLRNANTGREAVRDMLETAVSLQNGYSWLKELRNVNRAAGAERNSAKQEMPSCGQALEREIRGRFERSVYEGELSENANVRSLSALCLRLVNGFLVCADDGILTVTALESVKLFVDGLGFHVARPSKKRPRRLTRVLAFVRRSTVL
jgi:hypothetical protein